jgi:hypothetical protein
MTARTTAAIPQIAGDRRPATTTDTLRVEFITSRNDFARIWRDVEGAVGIDALTASWAWTEVWLEQFGDLVPHRFAVGFGPGGPCGVALVTCGVRQRRGPLPIRTLHIGTAGEPMGESVCVEYNRLMVAPEHRAQFVGQLFDAIKREFGSWDVFELNGFAPDDAELISERCPSFRVDRRVCHVADLRRARDAGGDVVKTLSKSVGVKIRKNLRRFEERYGPVRTEWITDVARAMPVFDELVDLHQQRWTSAGHTGSFASSRFLGFHRTLIARLLSEGRIVLYRASAGEQVIGTFYGFVERSTIYHYQWGLAQFDDNNLSPGFVVGALCMQEAAERGYDEVNWLAGDVRYKRDLSNTSTELLWAEWQRGPWIATVNALFGARRWAKSRVKRNGEGGTGESE